MRNPLRPWHHGFGPGPVPVWVWAVVGFVLAWATILIVVLVAGT